jgi:5-carboxymethyl-2-hydroxymuconate isomerase
MPHCIVDYSLSLESEVDLRAAVNSIHQSMLASELFVKPGIKVRLKAFVDYSVDGEVMPFAACVIRLLSGRTIEQKQDLSKRIFLTLQQVFGTRCSCSVEIFDMENDSYTK